jgi:hypothetical protein
LTLHYGPAYDGYCFLIRRRKSSAPLVLPMARDKEKEAGLVPPGDRFLPRQYQNSLRLSLPRQPFLTL